jgi:Tol biopolymer transport system component
MNARRQIRFGLLSSLSVFAVACGDSPATGIRQSPQGASAQLAQAASVVVVTLPGRIVYTAKGVLHIYNMTTHLDVNLRVSGVNPKFSVDGTKITYQSSGIRIMNADGSNQRTLSTAGGTPSFDPTGTMVAFDNNGIWKINADGTGLTRLTGNGIQPSWSPDGTQISYNALLQLFIVNADGSNPHQVLSSRQIIDPVWLPSSKVVFAISVAKNNYELHSFDPTIPSSLTRLTFNSGSDVEPSWSPDATHISWSGSGGIWIMNADGTGQLGPVIANGRQGSWGP